MMGVLHIYDVHESLHTARTDDWARLERTLADMNQAYIDAAEINQTMVH
jgi:hypothetical protein